MLIQICVGSSCHLKGAPQIVAWLQHAVEKHRLQADVTLAGSFCVGKCNRIGVTVRINDEVFTGVTPESVKELFQTHILDVIKGESSHG